MYEKINLQHPDKIADRIAGAFVDLAYSRQQDPRVAVEVLIGHDICHIIAESSVPFTQEDACAIVERIAGEHIYTDIVCVPQDAHLAGNQQGELRCGDNGIFKGVPITREQELLARVADIIYKQYPYDGKYVIYQHPMLEDFMLTICQSHLSAEAAKQLEKDLEADYEPLIVEHINPLGEWTGGINVDTGATNRKLGSDMGDAVTGGGLCGKDLSKADVSCNIVCHLLAQRHNKVITACCAIGDTLLHFMDGDDEVARMLYKDVVREAREYIDEIGGFEALAEWGLIRPTM